MIRNESEDPSEMRARDRYLAATENIKGSVFKSWN